MTIERKWQMVRVRAGDYLLPSNSADSIWRIFSYREDGSAEMGGKPVVGTFWGTAYYSYRHRNLPSQEDLEDEYLLDWERWVTTSQLLKTRQEAIDYALECAERRGI